MAGTQDSTPITTRHEISVAKYDDSGAVLQETVTVTVEDDGQGGQTLIDSRTIPAGKEREDGAD